MSQADVDSSPVDFLLGLVRTFQVEVLRICKIILCMTIYGCFILAHVPNMHFLWRCPCTGSACVHVRVRVCNVKVLD